VNGFHSAQRVFFLKRTADLFACEAKTGQAEPD